MEIIKAYPIFFILTVALPLFGGIIGAYLGWDSLKNRFNDNIHKETVNETIISHDSTLNTLLSNDEIVQLGNKGISNGDRNAYLALKKTAENFGKERSIAISEIARIKSHHISITTIGQIKIERFTPEKSLIKENNIQTEELIKILLLDSQYLFRARSAQILSERNEKFVHEALLLSIFSDNNIEVLRESTKAFEALTNFRNPDFFQPYNSLGYWYDNSEKVSIRILKDNNIRIIPLIEFEDRLKRNILNLEKTYMNYWWSLSIEMCHMLRDKQKIEELNRR